MNRNNNEVLSAQTAYGLIFNEYPDVVDVIQLGQMLGGVSTKTCYELLSSGQIKSIKVGRAYKIPKINVLKYLRII